MSPRVSVSPNSFSGLANVPEQTLENCVNGFRGTAIRAVCRASSGRGRRLSRLLKKLVRLDVLVLDDWGLHRIDHRQQRDLMELLDDRYTVRSTVATSQYPLGKWYETMEDPTLADAILDRLVNNAHKIELTGESMRKVQGQQELENESTT